MVTRDGHTSDCDGGDMKCCVAVSFEAIITILGLLQGHCCCEAAGFAALRVAVLSHAWSSRLCAADTCSALVSAVFGT
jgi:hypothetical protein